MEGDGCRHLTTDKSCYFYPRPPGGGRRLRVDRPKLEDCRFLSTPSGWRATDPFDVVARYLLFLSTPSGWRATHYGRNAECNRKFLSTPSGWRATADSLCCLGCGHISIHALRVEGDPKQNYAVSMFVRTFLSTPSGWRATGVNKEISTTQKHFYPRPPGGGRQGGGWLGWVRFDFYPRPPGGGRQQKRTKFSSVFAQKGEEFASLRRGKRKFAGGVLKRTNFGF